MVAKERTQAEWNKVLTAIRDSGIMNMWGAPRYLEEEYGISRKKAKEVFFAWTDTFQEGGENEVCS